jgi:Peptidase M76 family
MDTNTNTNLLETKNTCTFTLQSVLTNLEMNNNIPLSKLFSIRILKSPQETLPNTLDILPSLTFLCRRSDETALADNAYIPASEFPSILAAGGRAFFMQPTTHSGVIHLIENRFMNQTGPELETEVSQLVSHEITHAVDALVHGLDLSLSGPLACSEVRAAKFGECSKYTGENDWFGIQTRCIRNVARQSATMAFPDAGTTAVNMVLDKCQKTSLFDPLLKQGGSLTEAINGRIPI